jgi:hypothetical protein
MAGPDTHARGEVRRNRNVLAQAGPATATAFASAIERLL